MRAVLLTALALTGAGPNADSFTARATGIASTENGKVRVEAVVAGGRATRVEFIVDGWLRHTEQSAPYEFEWDTARELDGRHTLELWAVAEDGRVATARVETRVLNRFAVSLAAPAQAKGEVRVEARANGDPQWVELLVDGEIRDVDQSPPFATTWDTREESDGKHTVSIWAVGPNGVVSRDSAVVAVKNGVTLPSASAKQLVLRYRSEAHKWQQLMRVPRTDAGGKGTIDFWRRLAQQARERAARPPHLQQFLCIHRYEGAWNANTGNGYFGGLQMNMDFMRGYGPELLAEKGTANNWTPLEQIWVAERAVPRRGFNPWPQTARMCGLL